MIQFSVHMWASPCARQTKLSPTRWVQSTNHRGLSTSQESQMSFTNMFVTNPYSKFMKNFFFFFKKKEPLTFPRKLIRFIRTMSKLSLKDLCRWNPQVLTCNAVVFCFCFFNSAKFLSCVPILPAGGNFVSVSLGSQPPLGMFVVPLVGKGDQHLQGGPSSYLLQRAGPCESHPGHPSHPVKGHFQSDKPLLLLFGKLWCWNPMALSFMRFFWDVAVLWTGDGCVGLSACLLSWTTCHSIFRHCSPCDATRYILLCSPSCTPLWESCLSLSIFSSLGTLPCYLLISHVCSNSFLPK